MTQINPAGTELSIWTGSSIAPTASPGRSSSVPYPTSLLWTTSAGIHLEPVTQRVNILRGVGPAAIHAKKTHCSKGHEFTPDNIIEKRLPQRHCIICARAKSLEWSNKKTFDYDPDDDWLHLDYDE